MHFKMKKIKPHFEARKTFYGCFPHNLTASSIINNNTARLHLLPMCLRKRHTSLSIQYMSRAWHPKVGDILCLAAVLGIPHWRGSCTFIHSPNIEVLMFNVKLILSSLRHKSTMYYHLECTSLNMTVCIHVIKYFRINYCKIKAI
jgi:hypothetical protein